MLYEYDPNSEYGPTYSVKSLDECPGEWLRVLMGKKAIDEILPQIGQQLANQVSATRLAADAVESISANPASAVTSSFTKAAVALGYDEVIRVWKEAQSPYLQIPMQPLPRPTASSKAFANIIHDARAQLPTKQDVQGLYKAASKCLKLDPNSQADADLRGLCGGLNTDAGSVGALRTHFGDAHGRGPEHKAMASRHAQLCVSAAGTISAFLMERWSDMKPKTPDE